jgi:hypothetical protein
VIKHKIFINQRVVVYRIHSLCPEEMISYSGVQGIIKGFRKIRGKQIVPLVELNNSTRIWILPSEIDKFESDF